MDTHILFPHPVTPGLTGDSSPLPFAVNTVQGPISLLPFPNKRPLDASRPWNPIQGPLVDTAARADELYQAIIEHNKTNVSILPYLNALGPDILHRATWEAVYHHKSHTQHSFALLTKQGRANFITTHSKGKCRLLYILTHPLGFGAQAQVAKVIDLTQGLILALKFARSDGSDIQKLEARNSLRNELHLLQRLYRSADVSQASEGLPPRPLALFDIHDQGALGYTMELCRHTGIDELQKSSKNVVLNQDDPQVSGKILKVTRQIFQCLDTLHSSGLYHGDINLSNLLFDARGDAHLSDIGNGGLLAIPTDYSEQGNSQHIFYADVVSREYFFQWRDSANYSFVMVKRDMCAAGVILYRLFAQVPHFPYAFFNGSSRGYPTARPFATPPIFVNDDLLIEKKVHPTIITVIKACLNPDYRVRPMASEIIEMLSSITIK